MNPRIQYTQRRRSTFVHASFPIVATVGAVLFMSCSGTEGLAPAPAIDGTSPTGGPQGRHDECGNGMDDNEDGRIDEECFCAPLETQDCFRGSHAERLVGSCADGLQACETVGSGEFGTWGACVDDTLPTSELCNDVDDDCDGAVDEECPCVAGETVGCGLEFLVAPCQAGEQKCRDDGTWSGCEGAVGPTAERCDDEVDNDCDGAINEGCLCFASPEECGNGRDEDCDGDIDEPACLTGRGTDPGNDLEGGGGACVPEICNDLDDNCDGNPDEGCAASCDCTIGERAPFGPTLVRGPGEGGPHFIRAVAYNDRDDEYAVIYHHDVGATADRRIDLYEIYLQRVSPTGSVLAPAVRVISGALDWSNLEWLGTQYLLRTWSNSPLHPEDFYLRLGSDGHVLGEVNLSEFFYGDEPETHTTAGIPLRPSRAFVRQGADLYAYWTECEAWNLMGGYFAGLERPQCTDRALVRQRVSDDITPIGTPTRLNGEGDDRLNYAMKVEWTGTEALVWGVTIGMEESVVGLPPVLVQGVELFVFRDEGLLNRTEQFLTTDRISAFEGDVSWDDDRIVACYLLALNQPVRCRYFSRDGYPSGDFFDATESRFDVTQPVFVHRSECGFRIVAQRQGANPDGNGLGLQVVVSEVHRTAATFNQVPLERMTGFHDYRAYWVRKLPDFSAQILGYHSETARTSTDSTRTDFMSIRTHACTAR